MRRGRRILRCTAVLLFWLAVWQLAALRVGTALLLPEPGAVLRRVAELASSADFWAAGGVSLLRISLGSLGGIALGTALAVLTSRFRLLHALFSPILTIVKSTPVASFIILALIWMGRDILPFFIALLMVLPLVWTNVSAGIASTDRSLLQVARVFGFSRCKTLLRVYVPSVMPYFASACRAALGLAWKAGIAAEVLTLPRRSIGARLYESKLYLETVDLFAWTLVVIICSLAIEKLAMAALSRVGRRGRKAAKHDQA